MRILLAIVFIFFTIISSSALPVHYTVMERALAEQYITEHPEIMQLLFHPREEPSTPVPEQAQNIDISVEEEVNIGCRLFTHAKDAPTIIFFHGNGETVPDYDDIGPMYLDQGLNFLATDYRGYGWSDGIPSTRTFLQDADSIFKLLLLWLREKGYKGPLFIMGRSLGSAAGIEAAVNNSDSISGLILESGFSDTIPLAKMLGLDLEALGLTEEQTFNNGSKIKEYTKPTLILHGQYDQLIPIWQAEKLHSNCGAKTKELRIVPGADHNSLIAMAGVMYFQEIKRFIAKVTGTTPDWRERRKQFKAQQQNS